MQFLRGLMNIDVWLAKRSAILMAVVAFLAIDFVLTFRYFNGAEGPSALVVSATGPDGHLEFFDVDDPQFNETDGASLRDAARVFVSRDFIGLMGFYTRSARVWVDDHVDPADVPRAREAAIDEYVREGGRPNVATRLRSGDIERRNLSRWVLPTHLILFVLAIPITASAILRCFTYSWRDALARERLRLGLCPHCKYELRGTTSPRCPECGKPTPPELHAAPATVAD